MKQLTRILAVGLISLCMLSRSAQGQSSHRSLSTSISDNNSTYAISIEGVIDGRPVHYQRQFDVVGMSQSDKDAIKTQVFDSLGLAESKPTPPAAPLAPVEPEAAATTDQETVTFNCTTCTGKIRLEVIGSNFEFTRDATARNTGSHLFPLTVTMSPGEYRYQYWQNGVLQTELPFTVKTGTPNQVNLK